ncbi:ribonucleoside-diphosphate reductase subunit alpha [Aestuariimicrobium kwangyangense]|uniref:ribonucleoside-diphosphate reductase subunit alpha n=1 Tax=Aestuariimicrobium kwangyangense TaxID=396389 RepID=UPI0003B7A7AF|nr:ribonucleoside-diphosphate reductase subunit alpha [Aestuariimicrobium kwangyangense]
MTHIPPTPESTAQANADTSSGSGAPGHSPTIRVRKRDGDLAPYDGAEIARSIEQASVGLDQSVTRTVQLLSELDIVIFDQMTSEQLDEAVIQVALQNVKDDPAFDTIACRLLVKQIHKTVFGDTWDLFGDAQPETIRALHRERFPDHVHDLVGSGLGDPRLVELFDLEVLAAALDPRRDDLLDHVGVQTMRTRYLLTGADGRPVETPQFFWMRVSMGLALNEADPTTVALDFYARMSRLEYLSAGSTLVNAGTAHPQLSNCFVMQLEDEIEHIGTSLRDVMWITKGTGGIGLSVTKLRAEGSPIRSNNTASTGPIPFMHTIDSTLRAVSRGGKKFGALCFYLENWHLDFDQFLDLRQNSGDPYRRTRTANTAVWISDEFMKRVHSDQDWYLFDPLDVPELVELTGAAFSTRYRELVDEAEAGRIVRWRKVRAREQFRAMLVSLQTTSHPWLTWKDTINTRALNDNTGTIHLSNLCTEICLPQDRDNIAVCNLASVNLAAHLVDGTIDWPLLAASTRSAVRQLDNLIDITLSAVPESEASNRANRAIGLGMLGFTDVLERLGLAYDSAEAGDLVDQISEFISWHAIDASAELARERGSYPNFAGSGWSRGLVPIDTLDRLDSDRGQPVEVDRTVRLDWEFLRDKVAAGMRHATVMAVAPTASIGLVAGTTPGLDPRFSQLFSRATASGKFLEVNRNLVTALKERGLWEQVRGQLLRHQGDLQPIDGVPDEIKQVYRTSFQLDPAAFVRVAARAQKWIDQAISRNIYLASRDIGAMVDLYSLAWRMGVKTTYYLHMMPRHTAEQSTVRVNKAEQVRAPGNRRAGFGRAGSGLGAGPVRPVLVAVELSNEPDEPEVVPEACPTDPMERLQCDSCQ